MSAESDNREGERKQHIFTLLPPGTELPDIKQITSVAVVPFHANGDMVVAVLKNRGIDLPGGHIEEADQTCEDTARREASEEVCVTLGVLAPVCVIESTMQKNGKPTYMIVMTGPVENVEPMRLADDEQSSDRKSVSVQQFLTEYKGGMDATLMRRIVEQAQAAYLNKPSAPAASNHIRHPGL